jgi:hypothetical protein
LKLKGASVNEKSGVNNMVDPSGGLFLTYSTASRVAAPGLGSMMSPPGYASDMFCTKGLKAVSTPPPGGKPMMIRVIFELWASAVLNSDEEEIPAREARMA